MMGQKADLDVGLPLYDERGIVHNALDEAVHGESLRLGTPEHRMLHLLCQYEGCRIEEQTKVVRQVRVARHAVCIEVLQVLYPQFHLAMPAVSPVNGLRPVVPVLGHEESNIRTLSRHLYLGDDSLFVFP